MRGQFVQARPPRIAQTPPGGEGSHSALSRTHGVIMIPLSEHGDFRDRQVVSANL